MFIRNLTFLLYMLIDITCYTIFIIFFNIKYFFLWLSYKSISLSDVKYITFTFESLSFMFLLCAFIHAQLWLIHFLGDAAFWINMRTGGHQDPLTQHGGCPVLVGSKWITNKWVGYSDQVWQYPCSVQGPFDKFQKFTDYYWIVYTF